MSNNKFNFVDDIDSIKDNSHVSDEKEKNEKLNIDIEKEKYINILYGKILYVLQINNKDNEFNKYKKFMNDFKNKF